MVDYSCFELKKKLQPKVAKEKRCFNGIPRNLVVTAKIVSGSNYRYEVFTEKYLDDFSRMKLIDKFVNLSFDGLKEQECICSIMCDGKPEIFKRFYNPDF